MKQKSATLSMYFFSAMAPKKMICVWELKERARLNSRKYSAFSVSVGSHCYSGQLMQIVSADDQLDLYISSASGSDSSRFRSFHFSQYYVQSLANSLPSKKREQSVQQTTIIAHEQFKTDAMRNITPHNIGAIPSTYMPYLSVTMSMSTYNCERNYGHQRVEWPCLHLALLNRIRQE